MTATATFTFPTATIFGAGALSELPARIKQMGGKRPLVVTDPGVLETQAFEKLTLALDKTKLGKTWELFHGVHTNPIEQDVVDAARAFVEAQCDLVIAFGGGSALDVGKACRLLVKRPDLKLGKFNSNDDWTNIPRCLCIPTTAGAGSEMVHTATITLSQPTRRYAISLPRLLPRLVILDPELTLDLPPHYTAYTGIDALAHSIEAFTSPVIHPICDGIALEAIHMIARALPKAYKDGKDIDARSKMLMASSMGGIALQKELGAAHALAHPLSAHCGLHHGLALALSLPHVMKFNAERKPGLYRRVALACGQDVQKAKPEEADQKAIEYIKKLSAELGITGTLRDHGLKEHLLLTLAMQAFADPAHTTNPVPVNYDDFKALYQVAL
jgi:4-hydroxybutyrate dehydrogenase